MVAAERKQIGKDRAGKDGGNAADARVTRGSDDGRTLRGKGLKQGAEVFGSEPGLVAAQNQRAGGLRLALLQSEQPGVDGGRDALRPIAVDDGDCATRIDGRSDALLVSAEYRDHRRCAGLAGQPDGARDKSFAAQHEQLFGLAQAAAGSGGEYDGGNRHRHQCTGKPLTSGPRAEPVSIAKPRGLSENGWMKDIERILPLGRELEAAGADYVLATVIVVEGSSYRKPGVLMLLASDGRRAGTVSGGCLEAQVASRAWWLTANGPCVHRYSTAEEDGERPYGSGCGGVVSLLLERRATAGPLLAALQQAFDRRAPLAVATVLKGEQIGHRAFAGLEGDPWKGLPPRNGSGQAGSASVEAGEASLQAAGDPLQKLAERALASHKSIEKEISSGGIEARVWVDFRPARPGLWIFGAGDDAQPLLHLAKELGWFVSVADGRSHLATRERFPLADEVRVPPIGELPGIQFVSQPASQPVSKPASQPVSLASPLGNLLAQDAAVVMSHSFEQDARTLAALLALDAPPAYIGVLGPQRRTCELLAEAARLLGMPVEPASATAAQVERWLGQLHAPMGLDLGAESPETIAFSVLAEIQKCLAAATALPLREVRGGVPD